MRCGLITCCCSSLSFILGALILGIGVLLYSQFETFFGSTVKEQMYINDNVYWWYDVWLAAPVRETINIHVFEVENVAEWRKSPGRTRLQLREVGPFVFRVERVKEQVNFTSDDHQQIWYEERTIYHFNELLSYESLDETVTVVNSELMILNPFILSMVRRSTSVQRVSRTLLQAINRMLALYEANLFIERPVRRVIFGANYLSSDDKGRSFPPTIYTVTMPSTYNNTGESWNNDSNISLMRLQQADTDNSVEFENSTKKSPMFELHDEATRQILLIYDRVQTYLGRMGVDVNPYDLLQAQLVDNRLKLPLSSSFNAPNSRTDNMNAKRYYFNSMMAYFQNDTLQTYDVFTGVETNKNAEIIRWNNQIKMDSWFDRSCNQINGTDGRQFRPFLRRKRIYEFQPKICRSVPLRMKEKGTTINHGLNYYRFVHANDFLQSPVKYSPNGCFCRWWSGANANAKLCNYDGILDLGNCYGQSMEDLANSTKHASVVILSNPHFSGTTTKSIVREVSGLNFDPSAYQSYVDIEPVSGIVLNRVNQLQLNMHIRPLPLQIQSNQTLREVIVPLLWYEELWSVSSEHQTQIKYLFLYPLKYHELAIFGLIGLGACLLGLAMMCICCCCMVSNDNQTKKKTNGKVSPTNGDGEMVGSTQTPNGVPISAWTTESPMKNGNNQYYQDQYPVENNMEDPLIVKQENAAYYNNQAYMNEEEIMMRQQQQQQQQQINYMKQSPAQQYPQYPLERLKQNTARPNRQTIAASVYSMKTLQRQQQPQPQSQEYDTGPFYNNIEEYQLRKQQRPNEQFIDNDDDPYYNADTEIMLANKLRYEDYNNGDDNPNDYRNDSGNDSWNSVGAGSMERLVSSNAGGGNITQHSYAMRNGGGNRNGPLPPPPPPPPLPSYDLYSNTDQDGVYGVYPNNSPPQNGSAGAGGGGGRARENLMKEIRQGTILRKTSTGNVKDKLGDVGNVGNYTLSDNSTLESIVHNATLTLVNQVLLQLKQNKTLNEANNNGNTGQLVNDRYNYTNRNALLSSPSNNLIINLQNGQINGESSNVWWLNNTNNSAQQQPQSPSPPPPPPLTAPNLSIWPPLLLQHCLHNFLLLQQQTNQLPQMQYYNLQHFCNQLLLGPNNMISTGLVPAHVMLPVFDSHFSTGMPIWPPPPPMSIIPIMPFNYPNWNNFSFNPTNQLYSFNQSNFANESTGNINDSTEQCSKSRPRTMTASMLIHRYVQDCHEIDPNQNIASLHQRVLYQRQLHQTTTTTNTDEQDTTTERDPMIQMNKQQLFAIQQNHFTPLEHIDTVLSNENTSNNTTVKQKSSTEQTSLHQQQQSNQPNQMAPESIRFYGPYRAYCTPNNSLITQQLVDGLNGIVKQNNVQQRPNTDEWFYSSFEDDGDEDEDEENFEQHAKHNHQAQTNK